MTVDMQCYTLYDMLGMVRLDCWKGGLVDKIGYVGEAVSANSSNTICGLMGLYVSPTVMIESINLSRYGGHLVSVSCYDPYKGEFMIYVLPVSSINVDLSILTLRSIIEDEEEVKRGLSRSNYHYRERRYKAEHSSWRSGSMSSPRESRIFKRR
ncbi:MAG: hypothetical protein ACRC77_11885 [Bacteroidales bacterium]